MLLNGGETCLEYANKCLNGQKIYGYEKNCLQGVVCPCPLAMYMYMTIIFKHVL